MDEHAMTDFGAKVQALMDEAYKEWQKEENNGKSKWDALGGLSETHQIAVVFGNFNYQVENGGLEQWIYNGYFHDDAEKVIDYLETGVMFDERCQTILDKVHALDQCAQETDCDRYGNYYDPYDEDGESSFIGKMINCDAFDTWYYEHCGKDDWWETVCGIIDKTAGRDFVPMSQNEHNSETAASSYPLRESISSATEKAATAISTPTDPIITVTIYNAELVKEHGDVFDSETITDIFLPTTKETIAAALAEIGVDGMKHKQVGVDEGWLNLPGELSAAVQLQRTHLTNIDELNYLASIIADMPGVKTEILAAALEAKQHSESVSDIINLTENLDSFDLQPAYNAEQYGAFHVNMARDEYADIVQRLETSADSKDRDFFAYFAAIESNIDLAAYGRLQAENEGGVFTEQGYLTGGDHFEEIYHGVDDIPADCRVFTYPSAPEEMFAQAIPAGVHEKLSALDKKPHEKESVLAKIRKAMSQPEQPHKPKSQDKSGPEL